MADDIALLIRLIGEACTNEQIRSFLRLRKEDDSKIRVSGKSEELMHNLHEAYSRNTVSLPQLQSLLANAEENGRQHIFFYKPNHGMAKHFQQPSDVASRLWGSNWQKKMQFPRFYLDPRQMEWADFRQETRPNVKLPEWTIKLYSSRQVDRLLNQTEEVRNGRLLITKQLSREWVRLVWVIRWRPWGLLEIRIPAVERESRKTCLEELSQIWEMLRTGIPKQHFSPWDLEAIMGKLVHAAKKPKAIHRVATALASHSGGGGTAQFNPEEEDGDLFSSIAHKAAIASYDKYPKLDVYWIPSAHTPFDSELRCQMGVYEPFGIRIGSKASPEAVDYVINRLRQI